jgi:quinol monooxygenase YgiN
MAEPLTFTSRMTIDPDRVEFFKAELEACSRRALAEPSCRFMYANQSATDPNVFLMFEQWASQQAFERDELASEYFKKYWAATSSLHLSPLVGELWTPLRIS